jgi:4-diphosphocytidyl-2-C-methyl-D-erythritol kinase
MIVFPPCKINIGLRILNKRTDGFHNLQTIFVPVPLKDALEIIPATTAQQWPVQYSQSGIQVHSAPADNLCVKAWHLLKAKFPQLPAVKMHLHKAIPIGAGLGGGSADGAYSIRLLNEMFGLGLSVPEMLTLALQLGSDCPFFIYNEPCYATGRGEELSPISLPLAGYQLLLINPGIHINTGWAFGALATLRSNSTPPEISLQAISQMPITEWKTHLVNDFEEPVFAAHPQLQLLKRDLYKQGAVFAAMSGSGSTFFALFKNAAIGTHLLEQWPFVKLFDL